MIVHRAIVHKSTRELKFYDGDIRVDGRSVRTGQTLELTEEMYNSLMTEDQIAIEGVLYQTISAETTSFRGGKKLKILNVLEIQKHFEQTFTLEDIVVLKTAIDQNIRERVEERLSEKPSYFKRFPLSEKFKGIFLGTLSAIAIAHYVFLVIMAYFN